MLYCYSHLKSNLEYIKHKFSIFSKEGRKKRKANLAINPKSQLKITRT